MLCGERNKRYLGQEEEMLYRGPNTVLELFEMSVLWRTGSGQGRWEMRAEYVGVVGE